MSAAPVPVLWLSGATAVGKSTVAYEIFTQVYRTGVRAAYVDVKQLAALRPVADDDVDSHRLNKALDRAGAGDLRVDTEGRSVEEVATEVRVRSGDWPDLFG